MNLILDFSMICKRQASFNIGFTNDNNILLTFWYSINVILLCHPIHNIDLQKMYKSVVLYTINVMSKHKKKLYIKLHIYYIKFWNYNKGNFFVSSEKVWKCQLQESYSKTTIFTNNNNVKLYFLSSNWSKIGFRYWSFPCQISTMTGQKWTVIQSSFLGLIVVVSYF